jgi:hypothetical protein
MNSLAGKSNHTAASVLLQKDGNTVSPVAAPAAEKASADAALADPELIIFPKKISQKDLLVIIRKNNDANPNLSYIITAGSKTLEGDFKGSRSEMRAYINLVDELKDINGLEKINIVIRNAQGNVVTNTDISLVTFD